MSSPADLPESPFRHLPAVDALLKYPQSKELIETYDRDIVIFAIRKALDDARRQTERISEKNAIDSGHSGGSDCSPETLCAHAAAIVRSLAAPAPVPVINATGIVLHTNLGRAPLGDTVIADVASAARGYCNLEFDLSSGKRGHRSSHISALMRYLTGAQDTLVVNNNAAALVLVLSTLANRKQVIISRGELIEIGGEFRIPDIMRAGGAKMIEVGTTNRTRLSDYEQAIGPKTGLIFKAHKSNYAITGFTEEVSVKDLAALAHRRGVPFVYDIGSGLLRKPANLPLGNEPDVRSAIADGADLITFSCDKLLGGPQGGVVAGNRELMTRLARAPLMRALRVGKLTLAALSSACRQYLSDTALIANNPTFAMMQQDVQLVRARAGRLQQLLAIAGIGSTVINSNAQVGGGSLPDLTLQSVAVQLTTPNSLSAKERERFAQRIYKKLMTDTNPVVSALREGSVILDCFTVRDDEVPMVAAAVVRCMRQ